MEDEHRGRHSATRVAVARQGQSPLNPGKEGWITMRVDEIDPFVLA